jgi:HlyD family secretion protein
VAAQEATKEDRMNLDKRIAVASIAVAVVAVGAGLALWKAFRPGVPPGFVIASGRIEGRITTVTPKVAGRVASLAVDEGQAVDVGAALATLEDEALRERVRAAEQSVAMLEHQVRSVETRLDALRRQVPLQIHQAEAAREEARARSDRTRSEFLQAQRDAAREEELVKQKFVSPQAAEAAKLKARTSESAVSEAKAALEGAEKRLALSHLGEQEIDAQSAALESLRAQRLQARAALAEQKSYLAELAITSPLEGTVLTRNVEIGERVNPGTPLFTLVNLGKLYLKVYVPEPDIGKLALGQEARVHVDAYPGRSFRARVTRIAQQAEFTPKQVETREERVKLVFAVELGLEDNPGGVLKPGMPADAAIRWQRDTTWPVP